jgi:hypothetical protein
MLRVLRQQALIGNITVIFLSERWQQKPGRGGPYALGTVESHPQLRQRAKVHLKTLSSMVG